MLIQNFPQVFKRVEIQVVWRSHVIPTCALVPLVGRNTTSWNQMLSLTLTRLWHAYTHASLGIIMLMFSLLKPIIEKSKWSEQNWRDWVTGLCCVSWHCENHHGSRDRRTPLNSNSYIGRRYLKMCIWHWVDFYTFCTSLFGSWL